MYKFAIVQHRSLPGKTKKNTDCAVQMIRQAAENGADLVLFPECFLTGYAFPDVCRSRQDDAHVLQDPAFAAWRDAALTDDCKWLEAVRNAAAETQTNVCITAFTKGEKLPQNTAFLLNRNGKTVLKYSKVHTCDFDAERFLEGGSRFYTGETDGICFGVMICYDREHPESARELMLQGAEIILVPNDCTCMRPRLAELSVAAMQNMCAVAMANPPGENGGCSCAFGPDVWGEDGRGADNTLALAGETFDGILYAELDIDALRRHRQKEDLGKNRKPHAYLHLTLPDSDRTRYK